MAQRNDLDLEALAGADLVTVAISHDNHHVDDSEPYRGSPVRYDEGRDELVLDMLDRDAHLAVYPYDHDDETVLAKTMRGPNTRKRDRGLTVTVDGVEAQWGLGE